MNDTLVSALPNLVGLFTGFVGSALIARGLGPDGMGQYALVMSLAGVATVLSDLGVGQTAIRYASRAAASEDTDSQMAVLRWAFRWRLTLVFLSTTAFFLLAPQIAVLWHSEALIPYMRLGLIGGVFAAFASVPTIYFQSIKRFPTNAAVVSAQKLISFAGIIALTGFSLWSLRNLVLTNLFASAIAAVAFLILVPKDAIWSERSIRKLKGQGFRSLFASPRLPQEPSSEYDYASPAAFLKFHIISTVVVMLILQTDVWMMGYFLEKTELGIYSVATRFTLPLTIVIGALNTALWPRASSIRDRDQIVEILKKTLGLSLLASIAMSIYSICAPFLATTVFGPNYEESRFLGQVLCLRYCLSIFLSPLGLIAYSFGWVRVAWIVNIVQLVVVVLVNFFLLPRIGPLSSAVALILCEVISGVCITAVIVLHVRGNKHESIQS